MEIAPNFLFITCLYVANENNRMKTKFLAGGPSSLPPCPAPAPRPLSSISVSCSGKTELLLGVPPLAIAWFLLNVSVHPLRLNRGVPTWRETLTLSVLTLYSLIGEDLSFLLTLEGEGLFLRKEIYPAERERH